MAVHDFTGKVALVTGASRGIGRAIAVALARGGASLALNYAGNEPAAQEALRLVTEAGAPRARLYRFDIADPAACAGAVDQLLMRLKDEDWQRQLDVNLTGAFNLTRAVTRPMMKARGGAIINLSSVVGEMGNAGQVAYAATKAGLLGLTKSVARELASRNIRCNAVTPGFIATDMTSALPEAARTRMMESIPLSRLGTAEDVANAVCFLASEQAAYVTGEVLKVNGGMYM